MFAARRRKLHARRVRSPELNAARNPGNEILRERTFPIEFAFEGYPRRVERMSRQEKLLSQLIGPTRFDELQIKLFVRSVDFVAHDRMTEVREVNTDLMGSPRPRN